MGAKIKKLSVFPFESTKSKTKAFASLELELAGGDSIWLNGLTVVDGAKGLFVGYPQQKKGKPKDGEEQKWEDIYFFKKEVKAEIQEAILAEYHKKVGK